MLFKITEVPPSVEIQRHLTAIRIEEWLRNDLFHLKWWLLLAIITASLLVWWYALDKSRLRGVILYAGLAAIFFMGIDEYGEELVLWVFPVDIIPIFPVVSSINLVIPPLVFSIIFQHAKTWKSFILSAAIATAAICFIIEPLLAWGGFYQLIRWKYHYSFFIYALAAIAVRALVIRIHAVARLNSSTSINHAPLPNNRMKALFARKPLR